MGNLTVTSHASVTSTTATASQASRAYAAGELILVGVTGDSDSSGTPNTMTVSSTASVGTNPTNWTLIKRDNTNNISGLGGTAEIWAGYTAAGFTGIISGTNSYTVASGRATEISLQRFASSGNAFSSTPASNFGATVGAGFTTATATYTQVITTTGTNSWCWGKALNYTTNATMTANGSTSIFGQGNDGDGDQYVTFAHSSSTTQPTIASASALTLGGTFVATAKGHIVVVEVLDPGSSSGASPTPATVAGAASVPTPAMATGSNVAATAVAGAASVPTPVMHTGSTVTAATVAGQASVPTPTAGAGVGVTATTVAGATSIPTLTPSVGSGTLYSVWPATNGPVSDALDHAEYSMGMAFTSSSNCTLTKIRWWRAGTGSPPPTEGGIYDFNAGTLISAKETLADPGSAVGWVEWTLATPLSLTAATVYLVGVFGETLGYSATANYFDTGPGATGVTSGVLRAPASSELTHGQDTFITPSAGLTFPTSGFNAGNYWIDVVVNVGTSPDASVSAATVAGSTSIPTGTVGAGETVTATAVAGQASIATPTVSAAGNASPHPTTVAGQASVPTLTPSTGGTGQTVTPTTVTGTTEFPTLTGSQSATATPTTVAGTASIPTVTPATTGNGSPQAVDVVGQASIPTPTLTMGTAANPHATTVTGQATVPAPVVTVPISQTVTAVTVTGQGSVGTVSISVAHTGTWSIWDGVVETTIVPDRYWTGGSLIGLIYSGLWDGSTLT